MTQTPNLRIPGPTPVPPDILEAVAHPMVNHRGREFAALISRVAEKLKDFKKRAIDAIEALIATNTGERIVVVCHGGVINAYVGHIIGSRYDMFFRPAHASVSIVVSGDGRRVLRLLNDTHHLTTAEGDFASY